MSSSLTTPMFERIKAALQNKGQGTSKDILKLEIGKSYVVRLLPNLKSPEDTIYHYYHHTWNSLTTGQLISVVSPQTWGERDPISEYTLRKWEECDEKGRNLLRKILRKENWMVNVYVISDPTNPENEGKVKILRYGKQLHKIISSAIDGDDAEEFGEKVFDLINGSSLKIKVEKTADSGENVYPTYTSSRFMAPSKLKGLSDEDVKKIYDGVFDLANLQPRHSYEEIEELFNTHFLGKSKPSNEDNDDLIPDPSKDKEKEDDDDIDVTPTVKEDKEPSKKAAEKKQEEPAASDDSDEIEKLLAELDSQPL